MHICPQEIILFIAAGEGIIPYLSVVYYTKILPLWRKL